MEGKGQWGGGGAGAGRGGALSRKATAIVATIAAPFQVLAVVNHGPREAGKEAQDRGRGGEGQRLGR